VRSDGRRGQPRDTLGRSVVSHALNPIATSPLSSRRRGRGTGNTPPPKIAARILRVAGEVLLCHPDLSQSTFCTLPYAAITSSPSFFQSLRTTKRTRAKMLWETGTREF
jgi:hypothetical protein